MSIFQYFMFCINEDQWPAMGGHDALHIGAIEDEL